MVCLDNRESLGNSARNEEEGDVSVETVTKLEPILTKSHTNQSNSLISNILKSPTDNVKARLMSANLNKDADHLNLSLEQLNLADTPRNQNFKRTHSAKSVHTISSRNIVNGMLASGQRGDDNKLEAIEVTKQFPGRKENAEEEKLLGEYYNRVLSSVQSCNDVVDHHKETLETSKRDAENLVKKLEETDKLNLKLKNGSFTSKTLLSFDRETDLANEILKEEYLFQKGYKISEDSASNKYDLLIKMTDKNGNITKKDTVTIEEKRRLLETLKAIDNGDSVDVPVTDHSINKKGKLMKELFGDIDN